MTKQTKAEYIAALGLQIGDRVRFIDSPWTGSVAPFRTSYGDEATVVEPYTFGRKKDFSFAAFVFSDKGHRIPIYTDMLEKVDKVDPTEGWFS